MSKQLFDWGVYVFDIDYVDEMLEDADVEVEDVPVEAVARLLGLIRVDPEYAASHPHPDKPIYVGVIPDEEGIFGLPIDGWHRIRHHADKGTETIQAIFLTPQQTYDALLRGDAQYRAKLKKADPTIRVRKTRRRKRRTRD